MAIDLHRIELSVDLLNHAETQISQFQDMFDNNFHQLFKKRQPNQTSMIKNVSSCAMHSYNKRE